MKNTNRPSRHKIFSILLQVNIGILWSVCIAQETESLSTGGVAICSQLRKIKIQDINLHTTSLLFMDLINHLISWLNFLI